MRAAVEALDGARQQLAATVAALRQPAAYSDGGGTVEAIETHMSWVFLTETHAYKLKKPIRTWHFDYTTVDARRHACETELLLNRRLARAIYLDALPVVTASGGYRVAGEGVPIDWLVKMRRLPRDQMLDARIEQRNRSARGSRSARPRLGCVLQDHGARWLEWFDLPHARCFGHRVEGVVTPITPLWLGARRRSGRCCGAAAVDGTTR